MPTDEEYLEDLRDLSEELGKPPTKADMNEKGPHSVTPYYTRWDSWNAALEAAGLGTNHEVVSTEALLEELRRVADEHGEPVLVVDVEEHGNYDPATYFRRFDSWFDARKEAGLIDEDIRPGRRVDEEELIEALQDLAMDLGRLPSQSEVNERGEYSLSPYLTQWGTWDQALKTAGLETPE
ncbi:hypothetical protein CV102_18165 [Natronococcus pandeyae]|uniref:Uncharacterized protein n=1 Tax=Natronococcus pandeyae TaxID=2055836 RepID=A0A8J8TQT9_9EURY|nr:hypothetical protein [Natronococcus pandeyae]TYL37240.1 hypothetical protein CV102_18165 [Natronococcus pandeyae]